MSRRRAPVTPRPCTRCASASGVCAPPSPSLPMSSATRRWRRSRPSSNGSRASLVPARDLDVFAADVLAPLRDQPSRPTKRSAAAHREFEERRAAAYARAVARHRVGSFSQRHARPCRMDRDRPWTHGRRQGRKASATGAVAEHAKKELARLRKRIKRKGADLRHRGVSRTAPPAHSRQTPPLRDRVLRRHAFPVTTSAKRRMQLAVGAQGLAGRARRPQRSRDAPRRSWPRDWKATRARQRNQPPPSAWKTLEPQAEALLRQGRASLCAICRDQALLEAVRRFELVSLRSAAGPA